MAKLHLINTNKNKPVQPKTATPEPATLATSIEPVAPKYEAPIATDVISIEPRLPKRTNWRAVCFVLSSLVVLEHLALLYYFWK
jgi:hypothetical protein